MHYSHFSHFDLDSSNFHFRSVDGATQPPTVGFNTAEKEGASSHEKAGKNAQTSKPPLYSLTFAHPHDPDSEETKNPLAGLSQK